MTDERKPAKRRRVADDSAPPAPRPREKHPVIPLPQRGRGRRPEISHPPTGRSGWFKRLVIILVWCIVAVLAAGAALRVFLHDRWIPLIWWNAFTPYVYLPAYLCLGIALGLRRWRMAATAAVVVLCHSIWAAPDFLPAAFALSSGARGTDGNDNNSDPRHLRLYYQNVNMHATDYERRIERILAADPDVIALVELVPEWEEAVRQSRIFTEYPHNTLRERVARSQQMAVFSKLPLEDVEHRFIADRRLAIAATVHLDEEPIRLFCLHGPRPVRSQAEQYARYAAEVISWISRAEGPRLVVGDLNATQHSAWYGRLLTRAGLQSAHRQAGRGYAVTWPNSRFAFPPIRIDHVLLSTELHCRHIREGSGGDSDHKPLICDVQLLSGS